VVEVEGSRIQRLEIEFGEPPTDNDPSANGSL
jgi:hypothetical protein